MKRTILLTLVLFLMTSVGFSQGMDDVTGTVTAKEKEMYEALKSGDMQTFEANLSDDFMSIYATGISDRAKELESLKNLRINSYEWGDVNVIQPAENVAIIMYSYKASGTWMNEPFDGQYYASSTWVDTGDGEWKAVMHTDMEAAPMGEQQEIEME